MSLHNKEPCFIVDPVWMSLHNQEPCPITGSCVDEKGADDDFTSYRFSSFLVISFPFCLFGWLIKYVLICMSSVQSCYSWIIQIYSRFLNFLLPSSQREAVDEKIKLKEQQEQFKVCF